MTNGQSKLVQREMPLKLQQWLKEQIRGVQNNTLKNWQKIKIIDYMEDAIGTNMEATCGRLLSEVLNEENN